MGGQREVAELEIFLAGGGIWDQKLILTRLSALLPSAHRLGEIQKPSQWV